MAVYAKTSVPPRARTLPGRYYTSADVHQKERERIFTRDWLCVGRDEQIRNRGDYFLAESAGESIIVVRGMDGQPRAFFNVCRHRGTRMCETPSGTFAGAIMCPYHAWTYALDGTLRTAPFLPALREHRAALSLHRVDVATWGGFVFARLEPPAGPDPADPLPATLGEIPARVAAYPLAGLRTGARRRYDVAANWKVILENYNECYHCGPVHPELCELVPAFRRGGGDLDWEAGIPHRPGATTFTSTGTTHRAPFPGLSEAERTRHFGELVLPNLMLSLSADHVAAFTVWPRSAGQTTVLCDFLFHPAELARPDFDPSDAAGFWDLVNRQDWSICEQVQDGMGSRRFSAGYLAPMEQPSADIGRYVAARLDRI